MNNIIVIPVYKPLPDETEKMSFGQCIKVLGKHEVCLVCPQDMDVSAYEQMAGKPLRAERFEGRYFLNVDAYSDLMKSNAFYKRFRRYAYMLIYQLDAWVFDDRLDEWCRKGYDYVGAPWFKDWLSHEEGYDFMCVGNGGFSLRRIKTFLKITKPSRKLYGFSDILSRHTERRRRYYNCLKEYFSYGNTIRAFMEEKGYRWEDVFFCYELRGTRHELKVPTCQEAALFSIERSPKYVLEEVNGGRLPFGCHAWKKYQYEEVWKDRIKQE